MTPCRLVMPYTAFGVTCYDQHICRSGIHCLQGRYRAVVVLWLALPWGMEDVTIS